MTVFQAFLLSLLQGATEFLPVSSSGHLVLAQHILKTDLQAADNVAFVVLAHVGTLAAILWVFRARVGQLLSYCFADGPRVFSTGGPRAAVLSDPRGRLITSVILATVATAVIGLVGKDFFESLFTRPDRVGWALCVTALLLALSHGRGRTASARQATKAPDAIETFPLWAGAMVGVVQGLAIVPGVSRSGSTIAAALLLGFSRRMAGDYSFLIAIPAIAAAAGLEAVEGLAGLNGAGISAMAAVVTVVVSALSGYVFLRLLLRFVQGGQFAWFALYCFAVGGWAIWWF